MSQSASFSMGSGSFSDAVGIVGSTSKGQGADTAHANTEVHGDSPAAGAEGGQTGAEGGQTGVSSTVGTRGAAASEGGRIMRRGLLGSQRGAVRKLGRIGSGSRAASGGLRDRWGRHAHHLGRGHMASDGGRPVIHRASTGASVSVSRSSTGSRSVSGGVGIAVGSSSAEGTGGGRAGGQGQGQGQDVLAGLSGLARGGGQAPHSAREMGPRLSMAQRMDKEAKAAAGARAAAVAQAGAAPRGPSTSKAHGGGLPLASPPPKGDALDAEMAAVAQGGPLSAPTRGASGRIGAGRSGGGGARGHRSAVGADADGTSSPFGGGFLPGTPPVGSAEKSAISSTRSNSLVGGGHRVLGAVRQQS